MKDKLPEAQDREMLALTQASAERGADIIKQLLTFSRGQAGERTALQVHYPLKDMITFMRETFPRAIEVQSQVPPGLWPIVADRTQLHQVLLNLCVNARDAMLAGGSLKIGASNLTLREGDPRLPPRTKPGPFVVMEVSDTGHGIPPEVRHRIFDPFFTTKPLGRGTGLGLSTLLGIVHSHGGFVEVDSVPDHGSTFRVCFPAVPNHLGPLPEAGVVPVAAPVPRAAGQTLLLVEDEAPVRELLRLALERQGYRVLPAVDGADALLQYLANRPAISLVLTDLRIPVMGGVDLIRALRGLQPGLPLIATSGNLDSSEEQNLAALGVREFLRKPCSLETLLATVQERLAGG